jgi:hypothetical protein
MLAEEQSLIVRLVTASAIYVGVTTAGKLYGTLLTKHLSTDSEPSNQRQIGTSRLPY